MYQKQPFADDLQNSVLKFFETSQESNCDKVLLLMKFQAEKWNGAPLLIKLQANFFSNSQENTCGIGTTSRSNC